MFGSENKRNVNRQEWKPDQLLRTLYKIWRGIFAAFKVLLGAAVTVFLIVAICGFVFAKILLTTFAGISSIKSTASSI